MLIALVLLDCTSIKTILELVIKQLEASLLEHLSLFASIGVIVFGSDQEVAELMKAVKRMNATGHFNWIGSDGWSARALVSEGKPRIGCSTMA